MFHVDAARAHDEAPQLEEVRLTVDVTPWRGPRRRVVQVSRGRRRGIVLVLLEMAVEVGLLAETSLAQRARERTLAVVDVADMTLQVRRDAKRTLTVAAAVRLFTRVSSQVTGQVRRPRKHLAAEPTAVAVRMRLLLSLTGSRRMSTSVATNVDGSRVQRQRHRAADPDRVLLQRPR